MSVISRYIKVVKRIIRREQCSFRFNRREIIWNGNIIEEDNVEILKYLHCIYSRVIFILFLCSRKSIAFILLEKYLQRFANF